MKRLLLLSVFLVSAVCFGQDLKSMAKSSASSAKLMNNDFLDKLASDQVTKLTKKLNLSESQQSQANKLVMNQLRSDKFQKMLSKYTPEQLMSSKGSNDISSAMLNDKEFNSKLDGILDENQLDILNRTMKSKG